MDLGGSDARVLCGGNNGTRPKVLPQVAQYIRPPRANVLGKRVVLSGFSRRLQLAAPGGNVTGKLWDPQVIKKGN